METLDCTSHTVQFTAASLCDAPQRRVPGVAIGNMTLWSWRGQPMRISLSRVSDRVLVGMEVNLCDVESSVSTLWNERNLDSSCIEVVVY